MLLGDLPFKDDNIQGLFSKIMKCKYSIPFTISLEATMLMRSILIEDYHRVSLKEIRNSSWMNNNSSKGLSSQESLSTNYSIETETL